VNSLEHEFDCTECGRRIIRFGLNPAFELSGVFKLCGICITLPGWFRDPELRVRLDPDYNYHKQGHGIPDR
jgi:hypothetical protein